MNRVEIERAQNGWIVTGGYSEKNVYLTIEDALLAIYHCIDPSWHVGDRIVVQQENGHARQKETP